MPKQVFARDRGEWNEERPSRKRRKTEQTLTAMEESSYNTAYQLQKMKHTSERVDRQFFLQGQNHEGAPRNGLEAKGSCHCETKQFRLAFKANLAGPLPTQPCV